MKRQINTVKRETFLYQNIISNPCSQSVKAWYFAEHPECSSQLMRKIKKQFENENNDVHFTAEREQPGNRL